MGGRGGGMKEGVRRNEGVERRGGNGGGREGEEERELEGISPRMSNPIMSNPIMSNKM